MPRLPRLPPTIADLSRGVRHPGFPEPGYFRLKQRRHAPWTPALIWLPCPFIIPQPPEHTPAPEQWCEPSDRSRHLRARIGVDEADPFDVWLWGAKITQSEYLWRLALADWAATHAPEQPEANPRRPVDLTRVPSLF